MKYQTAYIYDQTIFDAQNQALRQKKPDWWMPVFLFFAMAILNAWPLFSQITPVDPLEASFSIVVFPMLLVLFFYFVFWRHFLPKLALRRCPTLGKRLAFCLDDDGLSFERDDGVKESWPWRTIQSVTHLSDGTASVAWIAANAGFVLPASGFQTSESYRSAREFIDEKLRDIAIAKA